MHYVIVFDVDLTLVDTGGAGRKALDLAYAELFGLREPFEGYDFLGRVDLEIFEDSYTRFVGGTFSEEIGAQIAETYLRHLSATMERAERYRVLPGVVPLLEHLAARDDCTLGLATGNVEQGARLKLARGDLNRFFPRGGFGSDSADRTVLTRLAIERTAGAGGRPPREATFVIGDSPRDIVAAKEADATAVAVATGGTSAEQLADYEPDMLLPSLDGFERWLPRLLGTD